MADPIAAHQHLGQRVCQQLFDLRLTPRPPHTSPNGRDAAAAMHRMEAGQIAGDTGQWQVLAL